MIKNAKKHSKLVDFVSTLTAVAFLSSCVFGEAVLWYGEQIERNGYVLRYAPIVKDCVTYATAQLFEDLASRGRFSS